MPGAPPGGGAGAGVVPPTYMYVWRNPQGRSATHAGQHQPGCQPMQRIRQWSLSRRRSSDAPAGGGEEEAEEQEEPLRSGSHRHEGESILTLELKRAEATELLGLDVSDENKVLRVDLHSVAYRSGVQVGDEITKVDGLDLEGTPMPNLQPDMDAGRTVLLTVRRGVPHDANLTFTPRRLQAEL